MRRLVLVAAVFVAAFAAPGLEAPARALTCAEPVYPAGTTPPPPPDPYRTEPLIFEGVVLSGPTFFGRLDSPARVLVLRWLKGGGPRIVRVGTDTEIGFGYAGVTPGLYAPSPGQAVRFFGRRGRDGVLHDNPCGPRDPRRPPRSPLDRIAGSDVRAGEGPAAWRAHAQRGPRRLLCVAVHAERRHTGGEKACEAGRPVLSVQHERRRDGSVPTTAVAFAGGPDVAEVELRTPDGPLRVAPYPARRPVLMVLPGRVDAAEIRARVARRDGGVEFLQPAGFPTALVPDAEVGGRPWRIEVHPGRSTCAGLQQLPPRAPGEPFAADDPEVACLGRRDGPVAVTAGGSASRKVLVGVARRGVRELAVRDPGGVRRLRPGPRGAFGAVYLGSVAVRDLAVEATLADGRVVAVPVGSG